jgi:hypothetical protein
MGAKERKCNELCAASESDELGGGSVQATRDSVIEQTANNVRKTSRHNAQGKISTWQQNSYLALELE